LASDADILWTECKEHLRVQVSEAVWLTTFRDVRALDLKDEQLLLAVPSQLLKERFEQRHLALVHKTFDEIGVGDLQIEIQVSPDPNVVDTLPDPPVEQTRTVSPTTRVSSTAPRADHGELLEHLNPRYTFEDFVTGSSNRFAQAAALSVAETPARSYNPLFIYGDAGLGKTHLLHAIGHYVRQNYPNLRIRYVSTETFLNEFIEAIRTNAMVNFKRRYREIDLLLIDDIQFMENKESTQEEFFHTFNSLHGSGRQIVLSSDRPPRDIATLEDRLRSRFEWGLITDIHAPDLETRLAILRKKADTARQPVDPEEFNLVLEFIATNITNNIRELEGALIRVQAFASLTREPLTLDLAKRVLADIVSDTAQKPITVGLIIEHTEQMFGFTVEELKGRQRHRALVTARQISMYVTRQMTDLSFPQIAKEFGGRDHTTVMYAVDKISNQMAERRQIYDQVTAMIQNIKSS
jgi:chromosomal replication initiator protein